MSGEWGRTELLTTPINVLHLKSGKGAIHQDFITRWGSGHVQTKFLHCQDCLFSLPSLNERIQSYPLCIQWSELNITSQVKRLGLSPSFRQKVHHGILGTWQWFCREVLIALLKDLPYDSYVHIGTVDHSNRNSASRITNLIHYSGSSMWVNFIWSKMNEAAVNCFEANKAQIRSQQ